MLTCSAVYNTLEGAPFMFEKWKKTADLIWWKNSTDYLNCLDRSMIFVMIAGTYTPVITVLLRVRIRAQDTFIGSRYHPRPILTFSSTESFSISGMGVSRPHALLCLGCRPNWHCLYFIYRSVFVLRVCLCLCARMSSPVCVQMCTRSVMRKHCTFKTANDFV